MTDCTIPTILCPALRPDLVQDGGTRYHPDVQTVQSPAERTFRASFALFSWPALGCSVICFGLLLLLVHPHGGAPETLASQLGGATLLTAVLTFFVQLAQCRVTASASVLIVVQPLWRWVFPWEQVADIVVGGDGGMRVMLADHTGISVFAFGGSVIGSMTGGIRAKKARDAIKAIMAQAASDAPGRPVTSGLSVQWEILLVTWVLLVTLSIAGWLAAPHHVVASVRMTG